MKQVINRRQSFASLSMLALLSTSGCQSAAPQNVSPSRIAFEGSPMKTLALPWGTLAYRLAGSQQMNAPVVLAWHSLFADHRMFDDWVRLLPQYRWVLIDGPGSGQSRLQAAQISMADCILATQSVLEAEQIQRFHAVGCSWGGIMACEWALDMPERVQSIAAFNIPFDPEQPPSLGTRMILQLSQWMGNTQFFGARVAGSFFGANLDREYPHKRQQFVDAFAGYDKHGISANARYVLVDRPPLSPRLQAITCPALVVAGLEDAGYPPEKIRSSAALIPKVNFKTIAGGHLSPFEQPEKSAALLRDHIHPITQRA